MRSKFKQLHADIIMLTSILICAALRLVSGDGSAGGRSGERVLRFVNLLVGLGVASYSKGWGCV